MFCKNCGNELCDGANVCPKCGCLASENTFPDGDKVVEKVGATVDKKERQLKIFLMVTFGLIFCSLMCAILAVAAMDIYVSEYVVELYIDSDWMAFAFI